jgi:hypothetical protein
MAISVRVQVKFLSNSEVLFTSLYATVSNSSESTVAKEGLGEITGCEKQFPESSIVRAIAMLNPDFINI